MGISADAEKMFFCKMRHWISTTTITTTTGIHFLYLDILLLFQICYIHK